MIEELKGGTLVRVLEDLYWIDKHPDSSRVPALQQMRSSQSNTYNKNYVMIDFYEWMHRLENHSGLSAEVEEWDFIKTNLPKYKEFISITNYNLNTNERMSQVMENYLSYDFLEDIIKMYEIFMREMEKVQLMFLRIYKVNNSTNPVALVPWSFGLNRLCKEIYIIDEDTAVENVKVHDAGKTEGISNKYTIRKYRIEDKTKRVLVDSPLKLFFLNVDKTTEDLLPETWRRFFDTTIKRDFKGYAPRLELLKGLNGQYAFYGRKEMPGTTIPKIGLINYPFFLDGVEGIKGMKEECTLTPLDEMDITIELRETVQKELETQI